MSNDSESYLNVGECRQELDVFRWWPIWFRDNTLLRYRVLTQSFVLTPFKTVKWTCFPFPSWALNSEGLIQCSISLFFMSFHQLLDFRLSDLMILTLQLVCLSTVTTHYCIPADASDFCLRKVRQTFLWSHHSSKELSCSLKRCHHCQRDTKGHYVQLSDVETAWLSLGYFASNFFEPMRPSFLLKHCVLLSRPPEVWGVIGWPQLVVIKSRTI